MFGFASGLAAKVRARLAKPKNRILLIDHRLFWSRAYCTDGVKDIPFNVNLGRRPKVHDVTEESFVRRSFRNDAGASFVKHVKTLKCDTDKTGRKYLSVLHKAIHTEGFKALEAGVHPSHLKYRIRKAFEVVIEHLRRRAQVVSTFDEIAQVGTTAANGDRKIGKLIAEAMEKVGKDGPIVIFICVVKPIELVEDWKEILQVIAALTQAKVLTGRYDASEPQDFTGICEKVIVSHDEMIFIGWFLTLQSAKKRCDQMKKLLEERLAKLSHGIAVIKAGGSSKDKMSIRLNNAIDAVQIALEDGIVPGGGIAFLHASKELDKLEVANSGQKIGLKLMQHALRMHVYTIASAAGFDGSGVVEELLEQDNIDSGYNQTRGEYMNMIKLGIVDPLKLVIHELECFCLRIDEATERRSNISLK